MGYIGNSNGIAKKVTKLYYGDSSGFAKTVKKAYIGDASGIARLWFGISEPVTDDRSGPMLAATGSDTLKWFGKNITTEFDKNLVTKISIMSSYSPPSDITYTSWPIDRYSLGEITCYLLNDNTEIVIAGNGSECIMANPDSSYLFYDFRKCVEINGLNLLNTSQVTNMNSMFRYCLDLKEIDLSKFDTSKVENMCRMFNLCRDVSLYDFSNFNTSNVKDMSYMFAANDNALYGLNLCNFDTSSCINMSKMFSGCAYLRTIYVTEGKWDTSNASITDMFLNCGTNQVTYV